VRQGSVTKVGSRGPSSGYPCSMKTAISIPDDIFHEAETLAHELRISRSQLYSRAVSDYVSRHASDSVTEQLDRLCAEIDGAVDEFGATASRRVLERTEW
jgi:hypothetical protein